MIDSRSAYMTGGYGMGSKRLGFAGEGESILVTKLGEIQAGSTLHPVLKVGTQYYLTTRGGGGGRGRAGGDPEEPG